MANSFTAAELKDLLTYSCSETCNTHAKLRAGVGQETYEFIAPPFDEVEFEDAQLAACLEPAVSFIFQKVE